MTRRGYRFVQHCRDLNPDSLEMGSVRQLHMTERL